MPKYFSTKEEICTGDLIRFRKEHRTRRLVYDTEHWGVVAEFSCNHPTHAGLVMTNHLGMPLAESADGPISDLLWYELHMLELQRRMSLEELLTFSHPIVRDIGLAQIAKQELFSNE